MSHYLITKIELWEASLYGHCNQHDWYFIVNLEVNLSYSSRLYYWYVIEWFPKAVKETQDTT